MKSLFLIVSIFLALLVIVSYEFGPEGRVYDCNMAEWHPDIPTEVRDECRRMRREYNNEQFQKKSISI